MAASFMNAVLNIGIGLTVIAGILIGFLITKIKSPEIKVLKGNKNPGLIGVSMLFGLAVFAIVFVWYFTKFNTPLSLSNAYVSLAILALILEFATLYIPLYSLVSALIKTK